MNNKNPPDFFIWKWELINFENKPNVAEKKKHILKEYCLEKFKKQKQRKDC